MNPATRAPLQVKICGLKDPQTALAAALAGAALLGFNFYPPSPRSLSMEDCRRLCAELVPALRQGGLHRPSLVGVFVNPSFEQVTETLAACGLDLAQLSGSEPPELLQALQAALPGRVFKALRPASAADLEQSLREYPPANASAVFSASTVLSANAVLGAPAYLVDAYHPSAFGGTGQTADWSLAAGLARRAPILLAGGLTPANVAAAVAQVQPWGVDVASGVESAPGVKDIQKISAFIQAAHAAAAAFHSVGGVSHG